MSVEHLTWALFRAPTTSTLDTLVLVGLVNHVGSDTDPIAWPSVGRLAAIARCDERSVRRSLRRLEEAGLIEKAVGFLPPAYKGGTSTAYRVLPNGGTQGPGGDTRPPGPVSPGGTQGPKGGDTGSPELPRELPTRTGVTDSADHADDVTAGDVTVRDEDDAPGYLVPAPPGWRDLALDVGECWQCRRPASLTTDDGLCRSCAASDRPLPAPTEESAHA